MKVQNRIKALIDSGEIFTLVDEAKKLNLTSKQFLSLLHDSKAPVNRIADPKQNCMTGNYARYQFVKEAIPS